MALTEKMEKFALAIVDGKTNKEAAISAGYAEKTASAAGA
ncbi:terminase small subunit, partial [Acinetobacter baumannii]|nr:terminase small subunit [Acinetobacter baumannii]MCY2823288.1 terminase small subunit [Acinetobacter baumannii]MCY2831077.1 terminase small subunit [Acinetobacter baumannii]MCY2841247.1 terminase small subunit [Acinetobacter baumannii]